MKRMYIAALLMICVIALGFAEYRICGRTADEILKLADSGGRESLKQSCEKAVEIWNERKPALMLFLAHAELEDAEIAADRLMICLDNDDELETMTALSDFRNKIRSLKESEAVNIYNLM